MPTGVAFQNGALYVADINKIYKYDNTEANLDICRSLRSSMTICRPTFRMAGNISPSTGTAGSTSRSGRPATSACRRPRRRDPRINPANGTAEIVALGVRNSVGGDVDPRTGNYWFRENARDWLGDDVPSDKLNHITRIGQDFGYPYCHEGDIPDPKLAMGHKCSEFSPPAL